MQQLAASMTTLPQTGGSKDNSDGTSFQDMISKVSEKTETAPEAGEKPEDKAEAQPAQKDGVQEDEKEELKAENLTANPNAPVYTELFRPEITPVAEETAAEPILVEAPVEAAAEPEAAVELPVMEMAEAVETAEIPEEVPASVQQTVEEAPKQEAEVPAERSAQVQPEQAVETVEVKDEAPEVEVEVQTEDDADDQPKAEAAEVETPLFHDAKAATVKVGETYETVDTQEPDMDEKLADTIRQAVQGGSERVEIRLTPENLGTLTIEMTRDVNGALQVVLHASNSRAEGLLNQHLSGLHTALQGYSQEPVQIEVQRGEDAQQQNFRQQADPDGRGQNRQQQQERREEHTESGDFLQKMRLGLFGADEIL